MEYKGTQSDHAKANSFIILTSCQIKRVDQPKPFIVLALFSCLGDRDHFKYPPIIRQNNSFYLMFYFPSSRKILVPSPDFTAGT